MANDKVVHVTNATFENEVMKANKPVLIDFWAPWCGPCKAIAPIVEELATEYDGKLKVVKINTDDSPETAARFGVRGIPTLVVIKDGKVADHVVGAHPKTKLVSMINGVVAD